MYLNNIQGDTRVTSAVLMLWSSHDLKLGSSRTFILLSSKATNEVPNSWPLTYFKWAIINYHVTLGRGTLVEHLTTWGTGLIASTSTFRPHPGRMRDLFRQLHAVRHGTETLVYSNHQREAVASSYLAKIFGGSASGVPLFLRPATEPIQISHECTLLDHLTAWGTGMIANSSTFRPHPGRVIRDLLRLLHAVRKH